MKSLVFVSMFALLACICESRPRESLEPIECRECNEVPKPGNRVKRLIDGSVIISEKREHATYDNFERQVVLSGDTPIDFTQIFVGIGADNHNTINFGR